MKKQRNSFLNIFSEKFVIFILLVIVAFLLRVYFVPTFIRESGDLRLYSDWGQKFWEYQKEFYYINDWYYAPPNYPPIISLLYGASYWMYEHKYVLPQIHNSTKLIPSNFIIYFYEHGYVFLLKMWGILGDIGIGVLVYYLVKKLTRKETLGIIASCFYLFNPITIFLSGVWGQTDSLVLLFGLLSFISLIKGKVAVSIPLLFISLYIKPNFVMFLPLYVMVLVLKKQKIKSVFIGVFASLGLLFLVSAPFAKKGVVEFTRLVIFERVIPTASIINKASVSAFNLHTLIGEIDITSDRVSYLFLPANVFGWLAYIFINFISFLHIKREGVNLKSVFVSFFIIGFGSYLFLTNMLERYFFAGFASLAVLMFAYPSTLRYVLVLNVILLANIIYSFFRRTVFEIADPFNNNNYLLLRILSLANVFLYFILVKELMGVSRGHEKN